jgi:methyl-accepting chemotaxis protein
MTPSSAARAGFVARLSLRARLIAMVSVLGALALACVVVAVLGLTSVHSKSNASESIFNVLAAIGVLVAIAITVVLLRSITRPLRAMTRAAERLAQGDVAVEIEVASDDEIGRMARAFRGSVDYLKRMADAARAIAGGNLTVDVAPASEADVLGHAFAEMRSTMAASRQAQPWPRSPRP